MECYSRESLWNDPVKRVQNKRGKPSLRLCVIPDPPSESVGTSITVLPCSGTVCLFSLSPLTSQFFLTYDLYIAAFAGAGITLLALVSTRLEAWHTHPPHNSLPRCANGAVALWPSCSRCWGIQLGISYAHLDCGPSVPNPVTLTQTAAPPRNGFILRLVLGIFFFLVSTIMSWRMFECDILYAWMWCKCHHLFLVCLFSSFNKTSGVFPVVFLSIYLFFLFSWPMWSPPPTTLQCCGT